MPYCSRCGVEVESDAETCPLCAAPIQHLDGGSRVRSSRVPDTTGAPVDAPLIIRGASPAQVRVMVSVPFLTAALIVLTIGLREAPFPAWASYAVGSIAAAWLLALCFPLLPRRPAVAVACMGMDTALLLWFFDFLDRSPDWFLSLALPIVAAAFAYLAAIVLIFRARLWKGLHTVGFFLIATAALCLGIDLILSGQPSGVIFSGWSLIVVSALLPLAAFLLLLHYVFGKRVRFQRYFHL